jgi:ERCC4-type nuclease
MTLKLLIDDREQAVIPFFDESYLDIEVEVKRLQIGDYAISKNEKILFIFERKSWVDLSASIKDGRSANVNKLILLRDQTNCKIIYLIEGKARHSPSKRFAHIPYKNLLSSLDHLIQRDNIHIIYSNDPQDTVTRLIEFANSYLTLVSTEKNIIDTNKTEGGDMAILTTTIPKTDLEITYMLWSTIPNITTKTATLFIDAGYHISDLFIGNITKEEIAVMKYPSGTIIGKRAEKIIKIRDNNSTNYKTYCNLLAVLPMITKKTAALILLKVKFNDLLRGQISMQEICDLKKTEKTKIGKTAAANIFKFLIKS